MLHLTVVLRKSWWEFIYWVITLFELANMPVRSYGKEDKPHPLVLHTIASVSGTFFANKILAGGINPISSV